MVHGSRLPVRSRTIAELKKNEFELSLVNPLECRMPHPKTEDPLTCRTFFSSVSSHSPAPGEKIFSTVVRGRNMAYAYYSGTSMAVPHVAAAAALVWSHHPECTNVQIRYALAYTAKDIGNAGCDDDYGYGIVKTKKALDFINQYGCTGVLWGQKSSPDGKCSSIDAFPATRWWWWKG